MADVLTKALEVAAGLPLAEQMSQMGATVDSVTDRIVNTAASWHAFKDTIKDSAADTATADAAFTARAQTNKPRFDGMPAEHKAILDQMMAGLGYVPGA